MMLNVVMVATILAPSGLPICALAGPMAGHDTLSQAIASFTGTVANLEIAGDGQS